LVGVSLRSIVSYEKGEKYPREKTLYQLARALCVSVKYLKDDTCEDPAEDMEKDLFIADLPERYSLNSTRDTAQMLAENKALFSDDTLSQEEKDAYFQELMTAYVVCREAMKEQDNEQGQTA
ncbi:MAG: helix-turn-helix domain-containing protein, partial [Oscillospiraceae bacterium]|nr:helix-turn-helix domain-containing protein [Oscillospiraceae bacterium]